MPLLDPDDVPFDGALLERLFQDLLAALEKRDRPSEDVSRLSAAATKDAGLLERLARAAPFGPHEQCLASLSVRLEISLDALVFFGRVLAAPFVTEAVRRLKQRLPDVTKPSGACPWCGSPPGLAKLKRGEDEEGKRVLFCSLCGESWPLGRLECPFCGSGEARGVLSVETPDPVSIETCDACKGYLKTVDERQLPDEETVVPLVAATATLHLDLVAEREGYARQMPYVALR